MPPHATVLLQDACYKHQYIRGKDVSQIVERPERIRAVKVGVAAALSHIRRTTSDPDDLVAALDRLNLDAAHDALSVVRSSASLDLLHDPAVKFVHGDVDGDVHIPRLKTLAAQSWDKIAAGESEIPQGLSQGDLYLCPESISAIEGALGTACEAVDTVMNGPGSRAFAVIRPPGHHCGEDTPEGFCFVNNVAVAAAHAHLKHGITRVVILDIDLHHGNGTQSIVWQINEESYRKTLESEGGAPNVKPGPQIYYGSIHDVLSYPCEDGKPHLVQAASVSLHGPHGQHIENVHLQPYTSESHFFDVLYPHALLDKAKAFLDATGGPGGDVLFFISCGMDASEHEHASMSRHGRRVPTAFYHRFTHDACALADLYAQGRVVSVLEGGYSDRALISGTMAHVLGLTDVHVDPGWWSLESLIQIEQAAKRRRGGGGGGGVDRILAGIDDGFARWTPPTSMTLRSGRRNSPAATPQKGKAPRKEDGRNSPAQKGKGSASEGEGDEEEVQKKLPKVILRLGPEPEAR